MNKQTIIHIDFETRSTVDLIKAGAHVYAKHDTTEILCMAYAIDDGEVFLWKLGHPFPGILATALSMTDVTFVAHNAAFEYLIWEGVGARKYNWPKLPLEKMDCTMVRAYAMGLPGTLDNASKAVGMKHEKDMRGRRIMLQLCKPRKIHNDGSIQWWEIKDSTPDLDIKEKYENLYRYCKQDVIVERELDKRILHLSKEEKTLWLLDQKINNRGVYLDEKAAYAAIEIVDKEKKKFNEAINLATNQEVKTCNSSIALRKWLKDRGVECDGVGKAALLDILEIPDLTNEIKHVILLRQEASKSSTAKLNSMITSKSDDSRVRGCLQYYGAASTGRWAGRRIQLQNIKRPELAQAEINYIMKKLSTVPSEEAREYLNIFHSSAIKPISDCIRAMLGAAPGNKLMSCDFTAVEARILAWLAGEEKTLNLFRGHGKIYEYTAGQIYNLRSLKKMPPQQRLIGKVATLALGFQGGVGAFQSMAKNYFIKIPDKQADKIKHQWRQANPHIVSYWYDLERTAISAVKNSGQKFACGPRERRVIFLKKGSFLFCRLPSGRAICYPYPKMRTVKTPWGEPKNALTYKGVVYGKFVQRVAYGGLIAENITQAVARDLLAEALPRFEDNGFPVVFHIHDEIITEVNKNYGNVKDIEQIMCESPTWAKDLPLAAGGWEGLRYRK